MTNISGAESQFIYKSSITGKIREANEDSVYTGTWGPDGKYAILAVADGMGGHARGDWASQVTIQTLQEGIAGVGPDASIDEILVGISELANQRVREGGGGDKHPPGSTLCIAAIHDNECIIANTGDSRAYLIRNGAITRMTTDDTLADLLVKTGRMTAEEAVNADESNVLMHSIGRDEKIKVTITKQELLKGDILLVCSDGLYNMITDEMIEAVITHSKSPMQAGDTLCAKADEAGGKDNISVALYTHGPWHPTTRKAVAMADALAKFKMIATVAIILIILVTLLSYLKNLKPGTTDPADPQSHEQDPTGGTKVTNDMYTTNSDAENLVSGITGLDGVLHPGDSVNISVNIGDIGDYSITWATAQNHKDTVTFSNPAASETIITVGDLKTGEKVDIVVWIHLSNRDNIFRAGSFIVEELSEDEEEDSTEEDSSEEENGAGDPLEEEPGEGDPLEEENGDRSNNDNQDSETDDEEVSGQINFWPFSSS